MRIDWTHFTPWTSLAGGVTLALGANVAAFALFSLTAAPWGSAGSSTARSPRVIANSVGARPSCLDSSQRRTR